MPIRRTTVLAIAAACAGLTLAGCSSGQPANRHPSPASTRNSAPAASASPTGATAAILSVWTGYVTTLTTMDNTARQSPDWDRYAALGAYSAETSQISLFHTEGIITPGKPVVTGVTVSTAGIGATPPTATLTACWDSRGFQPVFASSDAPAGPPGATLAPPHLVNVALQEFDYGWRVTNFTLTEMTC